MANQTTKVNALITAESIIAGFMFAYGALNGQLLIYWKQQGSPNTTYGAGIIINAIILTCLVSIIILFRSIDTIKDGIFKYEAGYNLFRMAIVESAIFVVINAFSISHFTASPNEMPISVPVEPCTLATWMWGLFVGYALYLLLVLRFPCLARIVRIAFVALIVFPLLGLVIWIGLLRIFPYVPWMVTC